MARPALYKSNEELQNKIDEYFSEIKLLKQHPTITGLAYFLGFEDRRSFYDYEKNGKFSYTIKRVRLKMESIYEEKLFSTSPTGAIFALKNFGWTDSTQIEHSGKNVTVIFEDVGNGNKDNREN